MKKKPLINWIIVLGSLLSMQSVLAAPGQEKSHVLPTPYASAQISVTGQKSGAFPLIIANAVSYGVSSPRDPASGLPTGRRQHKPVTITKVMSESSPLLFNSLVTNENLTSVVIQFIAADGSMGPKITLHNANIASFSEHSQGIIGDKPVAGVVTPHFNELEDVEFTFQKIEISDGKIVAEDDWESRI